MKAAIHHGPTFCAMGDVSLRKKWVTPIHLNKIVQLVQTLTASLSGLTWRTSMRNNYCVAGQQGVRVLAIFLPHHVLRTLSGQEKNRVG